MLMDIKGGYLQLGDYMMMRMYSENNKIMENKIFQGQVQLGSILVAICW